MLPGQKYSVDEILRILHRRKWLILLPFAVGLASVPVIAPHLPEEYRSETLIMVMPQQIPESYAKPIITAKIEDRLLAINDQILSRSRLERIIHDFDLYKEERARGVIMEDVVQRMRYAVQVKLEGKVDSHSFRVSYVSQHAITAQKVTARLASLYIEENLRDREMLTEGTNQLLESQLEDAKQRLVEHEKKLEEYRRRYAGQLPTQLQGNQQAIANAQLQLQAVSESLNRARERRLLVERQIADGQTLPVAMQPEGPTAPGAEGQVPLTTAQQLEAAEARLALYKQRYTADHPDVRTLERNIRDLKAKLEHEARQPPPPPSRLVSPAEAARQKRLRELQADLEGIDRQIATSQIEEKNLKQTIVEYQAKVDIVPARESDLVQLMRDYSTLQATYASLLQKREDSKLATNLERRQFGEQFKVLDEASLPERASNWQERMIFSFSGAIAGLILGVGLAGFLEFRDSSLKSEEDVQRLFSLPVLALVPRLVSERERKTARRRTVLANVAAVAVLLGSAAALVIWRLQS